MNLEKRIAALETETAYEHSGPVVLAICRPGEIREQAIERELSRMGITHEQAGRIIVVLPVPALPSEAADETKPEPVSGNVVNIKSPRPVRDGPLPLPNIGIV